MMLQHILRMFYTSNASLFCLNEVVKGMFLNKMKYPIHFLAGVQENSFCYRHNCHSVAVVTPFEVVTSYHFCLSFNWLSLWTNSYASCFYVDAYLFVVEAK